MSVEPIREKWKSTMTDRERYFKQLHYQQIDRCFNREFGYWEENFREWDIFINNDIKNNDDAGHFFGFDKSVVIYPNNWMYPPYAESVVSERENTKIIINEDGLTAEIPKNTQSTIPHFIHSPVVTPDDWKRCKEEHFLFDDEARIPGVEALKNAHPANRDYPLGISCGSMIGKIRDMLTFEGLAYACYDYPDMVEDMVETCCLLVDNMLDKLLPFIDFDYATGWEDICYKNGPIVTVNFFKEIIMPRYKRISDKLRAHDIDIWCMDCDGDFRPLLPFFLESGVNTMYPCEINACGHPAEILAEYGKDLRLLGGFDKMRMAEGRKEIKAYMESLVPLVERGGYIPFCDHICPPNIPPDNYLYYLELKEKMFGIH